MPDPNLHVLHELYHAFLRGYTNELAFDQKGEQGHPTFDDPVKLRFGAWRPADGRPSYYIAAISMDVLEGDGIEPTRKEKGFIALKLDPDPMIEIFLQRRADTTEDRDMIRVFSISEDFAQFHVPVQGLIAVAPHTTRFYSDDGRYCFNVQGDEGGKIVQYDTRGSADERQWQAIGEFRATKFP